MNNKNVTAVINALARVNTRLALGPQHIGAYELKLLRKAKTDLTKKLAQFTNPKAPARPRPLRIQDSMRQAQLFTR